MTSFLEIMLRRTLCAKQEKKQVGEEKGEIERETETHEYPQRTVTSAVEGGSVVTGWMKDEDERSTWAMGRVCRKCQ